MASKDNFALRYSEESLKGADLEGREIVICWDDDVWYDAIVVKYYPRRGEYKLVYRSDDSIEVAKLQNRRWSLTPRKRPVANGVILDGAIINYVYPKDNKVYEAMIYDYSPDGKTLKVAYLDEHSTDSVTGGQWDFLTVSPCLETHENTCKLQEESDSEDNGHDTVEEDEKIPVTEKKPPRVVIKRRTGKAKRIAKSIQKSRRP